MLILTFATKVKTSTRRHTGVLHTRVHYKRRNWDLYPEEMRMAMISETDPGLIMVQYGERRVCFDSVLLPSRVKGVDGKMRKFFGGRSHVLNIESMEKDLEGEVHYKVSMRKHTPLYDTDGKLFNDDSWDVSPPLREDTSFLAATSEICDRCNTVCTSEEIVEFHLGPECFSHPSRLLSGELYSHWQIRNGIVD